MSTSGSYMDLGHITARYVGRTKKQTQLRSKVIAADH